MVFFDMIVMVIDSNQDYICAYTNRQEGTSMSPVSKGHPISEDCIAARVVLDRIGDKWSLLVIQLLGSRKMRFNELKRSIEGISQRMLTLTVRRLERDGLVIRTVFPTNPPMVEYELTSMGFTLLKPVETLVAWAQENRQNIQDARESFDAGSTTLSHEKEVTS